jgi:16S rRNA (uracil1498-N3)-methyltransferase
MRTHRFIVDAPLAVGQLTVHGTGLANQLANVLRLDVGDAVTLCDGKGMEASAAILSLAKNGVDFAVDSVMKNAAESDVRVTLYCAVLKRENFEVACQKATEAGAARIVPVVSRRTVKTGFRIDRLEKIVREAVEQSGRGVVPDIAEPKSFKEALADAEANALNVIFAVGGTPLDRIAVPDGAVRVGAFIGPEGGWDEDEVSACRERGFAVASLGPRVLRAETAAVVATHLLAARGDRHSERP